MDLNTYFEIPNKRTKFNNAIKILYEEECEEEEYFIEESDEQEECEEKDIEYLIDNNNNNKFPKTIKNKTKQKTKILNNFYDGDFDISDLFSK